MNRVNLNEEISYVSYQTQLDKNSQFLVLKNQMEARGINVSSSVDSIIHFCHNYSSTEIKEGHWYFFSNELDGEVKNELGNCFLVDFNDYENILKLFPYIAKAHFKKLKKRLNESSYEGYKELLEKSLDFLNNDLLSTSNSEVEVNEFASLYLDLLRHGYEAANSDDVSEYLTHIADFLKSHDIVEAIKIIDESEIDNHIYNNQGHFLFPLISQEGQKFALVKSENDLYKDHRSFGLNFILRNLEKFLARKGEGQEQDSERVMWEEAFLRLSFPVALISQNNELIIHNAPFSKLKLFPSECMQISHNQKIEAEGSIYKALRFEVVTKKGNSSYFVFVSEKNITESLGNGANIKNISSEELGIISSSIAHELNNPLAGILAAITLLGLEDDWDDENLKMLADMQNGAKRCKELIEIFLGFSKASPFGKSVSSWQKSFEQANDLLRFRMVESNVRLDFNYSVKESFGNEVNGSIVSMIFYMFLSETMTSFAHLKLIMSGEEIHDVIEGKIIERNNNLEIEIGHGLDVASKLCSSKLINHLLDLENLKIEGSGNRLLIRCME